MMKENLTERSKFQMQNDEYCFPYHYLPFFYNSHFLTGREYSQGAGYLAYMMTYAEYINKLSPKRFLDVGCGDGRIFGFLNENIEASGCDLSERATCFARIFNPNVNIQCADVGTMRQNYYDVISLVEVMEHVPDETLDEFIKDSWATLREGGHCIISVPTINLKPMPKKHYRHYTLDLLQQELDAAGIDYKIESVRYILRYDTMYRTLLKLSNNHLIRLEFLKDTLWKYTYTRLVDADEDTGVHLFVDLIKNAHNVNKER